MVDFAPPVAGVSLAAEFAFAALLSSCYHLRMAQALIRNLDDDVAADYKAAAKANGRAYETELRETLIRHRPKRGMTPEERRALGDRLAAECKFGPDSTEFIREAREQRFSEAD